jgi:hypothetical protein
LAANIHFYLDENVPVAVASQLRRRHIEVVTARDLGALGDSDENHLERAISMGAVFCTHDADFMDMAAQGISHTGIVFGQQHKHGIGDWVRFLELIHAVLEADDMINQVEYL